MENVICKEQRCFHLQQMAYFELFQPSQQSVVSPQYENRLAETWNMLAIEIPSQWTWCCPFLVIDPLLSHGKAAADGSFESSALYYKGTQLMPATSPTSSLVFYVICSTMMPCCCITVFVFPVAFCKPWASFPSLIFNTLIALCFLPFTF